MAARMDQRGSITVWAAASLIGFIVAVGLGVDFAGHAGKQAEARAVAAQAARSAGQQVVLGQGRLTLDAPRAHRAASNYLAAAGMSGTMRVTSPTSVTVTATSRYDTMFLGIIGITSIPVEAEAAADLTSAIDGRPR
ncbi:MAG: pilus assembly protein [Propionibacteriaceae bacterium]|nr:pilus assembly protein [Propionibacteriaceae bacterium]